MHQVKETLLEGCNGTWSYYNYVPEVQSRKFIARELENRWQGRKFNYLDGSFKPRRPFCLHYLWMSVSHMLVRLESRSEGRFLHDPGPQNQPFALTE